MKVGGWRNNCAKRRPKVRGGTHPPKLCLQGPPVNRPLKSMTKTLPQSGYLSLISMSMVVSSLSACAVVTNNWSLFGPPKVHAVTEKTVGKYSSKVTEVPVRSKRRILEPRHLLRNQYTRWEAAKPCRFVPALEIGCDDSYEPCTPNAAFAVDTEPIAENVGR